MKKMNRAILLFLFSLVFLFPSNAWAIKLKLRLDFALGRSHSISGLDSFVPQGGYGLGLGVFIPYDENMDIETGYDYTNSRFATSTGTYTGSYTSHFLKLGGSYSGFKITESYGLLAGATLDLPLMGQAEVTRKSNGNKNSSSSFGGWGYYANAGVTDGQMDIYAFYFKRTHSYGLTPSGKSEKLNWATSAYGLGLGYSF